MDLPSLPKIDSGDLMLEVFTHRSLQSGPSGAPTDEMYGGSERLAELGGRVLDLAVTFCLLQQKPMLKASDIAKQREELLSDRNLQNWSSSYKLVNKLRFNPAVAEDIRKPEEVQFLLHSYIGAIFVQSGLAPIQEWASRLINPEATPAPQSPSNSLGFSPHQPSGMPPPLPGNSNLPMNQIALFNQTAAQKGIVVTYSAQSAGPSHQPTWTVQCLMNGIEKGIGVGKNQKVAKEEAVRQAFYVMGWAGGSF